MSAASSMFDVLAIQRAHPLSDYLPQRGFKIERRGARDWWMTCPFHGEKTASFHVYPAKNDIQKFYCFGCGQKGDVIEFVSAYDGVGFNDACSILGGERRPTHERPPVHREPEDDPYGQLTIGTPPAVWAGEPILNPKRSLPGKPHLTRYRPVAAYQYRSVSCHLVGMVLRVQFADGQKITPSIVWGQDARTGWEGWMHAPLPEPRPLYRGETLGAGKQVLVVEGEKCADAGTLFPPCVTWAGGTNAWDKTDWTPLAGRSVCLWPDADKPGMDCMAAIAGHLASQGCAVKVIDVSGKSDGWDIADAIAEWGPERTLAFAKERARPWGNVVTIRGEPMRTRSAPDWRLHMAFNEDGELI